MTTRRQPASPAWAPAVPETAGSPEFAEFARFLANRRRLLVLTHERPDGDAFGSLFGLVESLSAAGVPCAGYLHSVPPPRYNFLERASNTSIGSLPAGETFDAVVCVDCSNGRRVACPPSLPWPAVSRLPLCNVDHHPDNERYGILNFIQPDRAATAQLLLELLQVGGLPVPVAAASWLLVGLTMDTGGFQYSSTTAAALTAAATLVGGGAPYARIMDGLFFHEPFGRRRLAARLLERALFAHDGKMMYAVLVPAWFAELGVPPGDTEGLIDSLRVVDGVEIACLLQPEAEGVRLSLRARSLAYPVDGIAHELGGGGHALAAGAWLAGVPVAEAERLLLEKTGKALAP